MCRIILFFLLLLASSARAQQLLLQDAANISWPNAKEVNSIHFTGHTDVDKHFYFPAGCNQFYCSRKVKMMDLYDSQNQKLLSIHFDSTGNFIGWHQSDYAFERHHYKKGSKQISISELSYQSKIISKTIAKSSTKKQMRFGVPILVTKTRYISYDLGATINQRNATYNKQYLNNEQNNKETAQLNKRLFAFYPEAKLVKCKNEMHQTAQIDPDAAVNVTKQKEAEQWINRHQKVSAKFYTEGERFSKYKLEQKNSCCQAENNSLAQSQNVLNTNKNIVYTQNSLALNDSLFLLQSSLAAQPETKTVVAENDVLIGRESSQQAGNENPSKRLLYTFRYAYFGE